MSPYAQLPKQRIGCFLQIYSLFSLFYDTFLDLESRNVYQDFILNWRRFLGGYDITSYSFDNDYNLEFHMYFLSIFPEIG